MRFLITHSFSWSLKYLVCRLLVFCAKKLIFKLDSGASLYLHVTTLTLSLTLTLRHPNPSTLPEPCLVRSITQKTRKTGESRTG